MRLELRVAGDAPEAPSVNAVEAHARRRRARAPFPRPRRRRRRFPIGARGASRRACGILWRTNRPNRRRTTSLMGGGLRGGRWYNPEPVRGVRDVSGVVRRSRRQAKGRLRGAWESERTSTR
jgi:hypothetical protein